jgi:hypothetical protein
VRTIVASSTQSVAFQEFKVYDHTRQGRDWTSLVGPTQCAIFFKDFETAAPLSQDGVAFAKLTDCTFLVFDRLDDARRFCEQQVHYHPSLCCELFDCRGKVKPPLLVVLHPKVAEKDELSESWVRRRKIIAIASFLCAIPLFVWDWQSDGYLILPTVVGINLILFGARLLFWNSAGRKRVQEQAGSLKKHLLREKQSGQESSGPQ